MYWLIMVECSTNLQSLEFRESRRRIGWENIAESFPDSKTERVSSAEFSGPEVPRISSSNRWEVMLS